MPGTILAYREDCNQPRVHLVLKNGDQVVVVLDSSGVAIFKLGDDYRILFECTPDVGSKLCASLIDVQASTGPSALRVLAAVVIQLDDADQIEAVFRAAAAQV